MNNPVDDVLACSFLRHCARDDEFTPTEQRIFEAAAATIERLRTALDNLTLAAGVLNVATDGQGQLRPQRLAVLRAISDAVEALNPHRSMTDDLLSR